MGTPWTAEELKLLAKYYPLCGTKVTQEDIEKLFKNHSWNAIQHTAHRNRIKILHPDGIDRDFLQKLEKAVKNI